MSHDPSLVIGDNMLHQYEDWAKYLLKWMGFVKRKCTTKAKVDVAEFEGTR